eukprot:1375716-Amorphochlora_amoeboformis.AAC.1
MPMANLLETSAHDLKSRGLGSEETSKRDELMSELVIREIDSWDGLREFRKSEQAKWEIVS